MEENRYHYNSQLINTEFDFIRDVDVIVSKYIVNNAFIDKSFDMEREVKEKLAHDLLNALLEKNGVTLFTHSSSNSFETTYIARCMLLKKEAVKRFYHSKLK